MSAATFSAVPAATPVPRIATRRPWLLAWTVAALVGAAGLGGLGPGGGIDEDLARLMRFMALLKGGFAAIALAGAWWRLARPASRWREIVYVAGPGLMAGGSVALWHLDGLGSATLGLHAGMFALLAASLTDPDFIPARRRAA